MLLSKEVELKWNSRNKKHYVDLGYIYTRMGDTFYVDVNDLTKGSDINVDVKCDYCGNVYKKSWNRYVKENIEETIKKDCCNECKKFKIIETSLATYGVNSVFKLDSVKDKIANTNIKKYGAKNPFSSDIIKEKILNTNIEKYGVTSPLKSKKLLKKMSNTCIERYGVPYYIQFILPKKGELNIRWKGGVSYHREERATYEYSEWRNYVFKRDFYTCQCCGDKSRSGHAVKICAHHIKNWNDFPSERYNVDNGITLCEPCHIKFHSEFGKKNNNEEQLKKFLNIYGKKIC